MSESVVIVLGAGAGIGTGCARMLSAAGAHVACVDVDHSVARATVERVRDDGGRASAHLTDVLDRRRVRQTFAEVVLTYGHLDGVVNVVGRSHLSRAVDIDDDIWAHEFDINLRHQFIAAQETVSYLQATRGAYVAIASVNGLGSSPHSMAYGSAKAALISMIRTMAVEFAPIGVRFNAVAPGLVQTPHLESIGIFQGEKIRPYLETIPLGKPADPLDIGSAVFYLLSPLGRHITGQVLAVDGGSSANYCLPWAHLS